MVVFVRHRPPIPRFHAPSPTRPPAVFLHHHAPAQRWFSYTIADPSDGGFCTPSRACQRWFSCTIVHPSRDDHHVPAQRRFLYTIVHPPSGGFRAPSYTCLTVVFYTIAHPPSRWQIWVIHHHRTICSPPPPFACTMFQYHSLPSQHSISYIHYNMFIIPCPAACGSSCDSKLK